MKKFKGFFLALFCASVFSCTPGKMVGTGYLVTVTEGRKTVGLKTESVQQVDNFILDKTGLMFNTPDLIDNPMLFYDFRNSNYYVYVEKKAIYQRRENGKKQWRTYREMQKL